MVVVFALIFTTDPCVSTPQTSQTSQVPPAVPHPDGYFDGEVPFCGTSKGDPQGALEAGCLIRISLIIKIIYDY